MGLLHLGSNEIQADEMLSRVIRFEGAGYEAKHRVIAWLADRTGEKKDYGITIRRRMTAELFPGRKNEESA